MIFIDDMVIMIMVTVNEDYFDVIDETVGIDLILDDIVVVDEDMEDYYSFVKSLGYMEEETMQSK